MRTFAALLIMVLAVSVAWADKDSRPARGDQNKRNVEKDRQEKNSKGDVEESEHHLWTLKDAKNYIKPGLALRFRMDTPSFDIEGRPSRNIIEIDVEVLRVTDEHVVVTYKVIDQRNPEPRDRDADTRGGLESEEVVHETKLDWETVLESGLFLEISPPCQDAFKRSQSRQRIARQNGICIVFTHTEKDTIEDSRGREVQVDRVETYHVAKDKPGVVAKWEVRVGRDLEVSIELVRLQEPRR